MQRLHYFDKFISYGYWPATNNGIPYYDQDFPARFKRSSPLHKTLFHFTEIPIWCGFRSGKGVVFPNLIVPCVCDISINPMQTVSMIFVVIIGIEIWR